MNYLIYSAIAIAGYLFGSISFALVVGKLMYNTDVREKGSKSAGATNVFRTLGKKAAILVTIGDVLKGVIAYIIGSLIGGLIGNAHLGGVMGGFAAILGHNYPLYFKFKGGKGVATTAAMVLTLDPVCFLCLIAVFIVLVATTKYVSLGSIICCMLYPLITYNLATWGQGFSVLISFVVAAVVIFMHRENIKRLRNHTENKISFSKKNKEKK